MAPQPPVVTDQPASISDGKPLEKVIPVGILVSVSGKKRTPVVVPAEPAPEGIRVPAEQRIDRTTDDRPLPVIRQYADDSSRPAQLLKRYALPLVLSGCVHTLLIAAFVWYYDANLELNIPSEDDIPIRTRLEEADAGSELAEIDLTFAVNPVELSVDAPVIADEPVGVPSKAEDFAGPTGPMSSDLGSIGSFNPDDGLLGGGLGLSGAGGPLGMSGLPAEVKRRLALAGGKSGQIQITLVWNNQNDLDLHCIDPKGEEIFYGNAKSTKGSDGHLDVDRNAGGKLTNSPVENIYFPQGKAPKGKYMIYVNHFAKHAGTDPTAFHVYVKVNQQLFKVHGKISHGEAKRLVYEFDLSKD